MVKPVCPLRHRHLSREPVGSRLTLAGLVIGSLTAWACGGTGPEDPEVQDVCGEATSTSTVGTYTLRTVKDSTLPTIAIQVGNDTLWAQHGNIELKNDDTYSLLVHFRMVEAGSYRATPQTEVGAYAVVGTTIQFSERRIQNNAVSTGGPIGRDAGDLTGSLTGITLTVIAPLQAFGLAAEAKFVFCK